MVVTHQVRFLIPRFPETFPIAPRCLLFDARGRSGHWKETPMAEQKKQQADTGTPSEDLIAQAVREGQALIAAGKTQGGGRNGDLSPPQREPSGGCPTGLRRGCLAHPQGSPDLLVQLPQEALAGTCRAVALRW